MITIAIVGILAAIAIPSYTAHVKKTRRNMAAACLMENAQYMERWYTSKMTYEDASAQSCPTEMQAFYTLSIEASGPRTFTLKAAPKGGQSGDKCGTLTLDEKGMRKASGGTVGACW
jgi:type IV pilus assembly protein PilE